MVVADAAFYSAVIEAVFSADALGGLDVTGYRWDPSDAWTQARRWDPIQTTKHLECWLDLGGSSSLTQAHINHDSELHIPLRFVEDDDAVSQGRIHAAIRAAVDTLSRFNFQGVRASPTAFELRGIEGRPGWVMAVVSFTLRFPRSF